jgi:hypothetical protein
MEVNDKAFRKLAPDIINLVTEEAPVQGYLVDALINVLIARDPKFEDDLLAVLDVERASKIESLGIIQRAYDTVKGIADEVRAKKSSL